MIIASLFLAAGLDGGRGSANASPAADPPPTAAPSTTPNSRKPVEPRQADALAEDRGTSFDHRFAGLPSSSPQAAIEVTPGIAERPVTTGEVLLDRTFTISQTTDALALARSASGYGKIRVDDILWVHVTHADGSVTARTIDFSRGCQGGGVIPAGPLSLTGILESGNNKVRFILRDACGTFGSSDPIYVVPVGTRLSDSAVLGSDCDLCAVNPTTSWGYPVNTSTGNETKAIIDLQLGGAGTTFRLLRTYNSASSHVGALGRGWNHPFESRLAMTNPAKNRGAPGDRVTYVGIDGQQAGFTQATDGTYTRDAGVQATLKKLPDGRFELIQPNHSIARFTATGALQSMVDQSGVGLTMTHTDGKLATVTDAAGRAARFAHDPAGLLSRVELPDGRYVQYTYTGGLLTGVRDTRGGDSAYEYNAGGRLTKATDPRGNSVVNEYDTAGRVIKQTDPRGQTTEFAYDAYLGTTITRPNGGKWIDNYVGNVLVGSTDAIGNHVSFGYDSKLNLIATTDARGNTTRMTYDARGNMLTRTAPAPLSYVEKWTYDGNDNVLTYTDGRGKVSSFAYDAANRVTKHIFPDQWSNSFTYTGSGQIETKTTARGHKWTYAYDGSGNLASVTSPLGNKRTMTYDQSGRLSSTTDPRGNQTGQDPAAFTTVQTYDDADRISSTRYPDGTVAGVSYDAVGNVISRRTTATNGGVLKDETFTYDEESRLLVAKDRGRVVLDQGYDAMGNLWSSRDATGAWTTYDFNLAGWVKATTRPRGNASGADPADHKWFFSYDANGNRTHESPPTGGVMETEYDALNRVSATVTPLRFRTSYGYDATGNVWTIKDHTGQVTNYTYDSVGRRNSEAPPGLQPRRLQYDGDSNLVKETSPSGSAVTTWTYDADGRQATHIDPRGNVSGGDPTQYRMTRGYDAAGNLTTSTDQLGRTTTMVYDARNNRTSVKDARGGTTVYGFDGLQRITSVASPVDARTSYTYDQYGDLVERKSARDAITKYAYNARGDLTSIVDPLNRKTTFGYDAGGNLTETITARGHASGNLPAWTIKQAYDAHGRRTAITTAAAASSSTFSYDGDGRLSTYKDATGTTTQTWNALNQLTGTTHPQGNYAYTYTSFGTVRSRTYPGGGQATYDYDGEARVKGMSAYGQTAAFGYDVGNRLTSVTYPPSSGLTETRTYDRAGDIASVNATKSGSTSPVAGFDYTRDPNRNPTAIKRTRGTTVQNEAFEYDAANRLTKVCVASTTCESADKYIAYGYDPVGNQLTEQRVGVSSPGTISTVYDAADQMTTRTSQSGSVFTASYTADGQLSNGREWDPLGRLTKMNAASFSYDALNLRRTVTTTAGTKKWSWDTNNPLPLLNVEWRADGSYWRHRYIPEDGGQALSGEPMYTEHPGASQPYGLSMMLHDALGTITDITNDTGTSKWQHTYEPFGMRSSAKLDPAAVDPGFGYTGAALEPATGEYHLRARDYNLWGFFTSTDPIAPDVGDPYVSSYVYANQQPTLLTDPTGQWPYDPTGLWAIESGTKWLSQAVKDSDYSADRAKQQIAAGAVGGSADILSTRPGGASSDYLSNLWYRNTHRGLGVSGQEGFTELGELAPAAIPMGGGSAIVCAKVAGKAGNAVRATAAARTGSLTIASRRFASFSDSEKGAALLFWAEGRNVTLREAKGDLFRTRVSDLIVDNVRYDVYTPESGSVKTVLSRAASKARQVRGGGVVIDLRATGLQKSDFGNALSRVNGFITSRNRNLPYDERQMPMTDIRFIGGR